jgi:hypothetical protein
MRREAIFEAWVPAAGTWSLWARPILFAQMSEEAETAPPRADPWRARWAPAASEHAAVVVDLPGEESVLTGLSLATHGYRPVPLFNACTGPSEVVDQRPIIEALRDGASYLAGQPLPDAPPAFLLDARRMALGREIRPGDFDNRWQIFPQDFPSSGFLKPRGCTRVLLVQRDRLQPHEDLAHVLCRWQDAGLAIEAKDVAQTTPPTPLTVARPPRYRSVWHRVLTVLGLRRGAHGGFGGVVGRPSHG